MNQSALELLITLLAAHLDCTQDIACQQILRVLAETGQPLAPQQLASRLRMSQEKEAVRPLLLTLTSLEKLAEPLFLLTASLRS